VQEIKTRSIKLELIRAKIGKRYCRFCGKELLITIVGAEYVDGKDGQGDYSELPYDKDTGKRRYGLKFECPKYKFWNLFSQHDIYCEISNGEIAKIIEEKE